MRHFLRKLPCGISFWDILWEEGFDVDADEKNQNQNNKIRISKGD